MPYPQGLNQVSQRAPMRSSATNSYLLWCRCKVSPPRAMKRRLVARLYTLCCLLQAASTHCRTPNAWPMPLVSRSVAWQLALKFTAVEARACLETRGHDRPLAAMWRGRMVFVLAATSAAPLQLASEIEALRSAGHDVVLAPAECIRAALERRAAAGLLNDATHGLARTQPEISASRRAPIGQVIALIMLFGLSAGGLAVSTRDTLAVLALALTIFFAGVVAVRGAAVCELARSPSRVSPNRPHSRRRIAGLFHSGAALRRRARAAETDRRPRRARLPGSKTRHYPRSRNRRPRNPSGPCCV